MKKLNFIFFASVAALGWGCQNELMDDLHSGNPAEIKKAERGPDASGEDLVSTGGKHADLPGKRFGKPLKSEGGKKGPTGSDPFCGDGIVDPGEACDGNCPVTCDDGNSCTSDTLTGDASTCDAVCTSEEIVSCMEGDGCCVSECSDGDPDCSDACGNGVLDDGESCDGDCPVSCDDGDACTTNSMTGVAESCNVQCSTIDITACVDGDGCCAPGCTSQTDDDCDAVCGNGVVEDGEFCDGDCPTTCSDGDACTTDVLVGNASSCNSACIFDDVTSCVDGDGCCAPGCTSANDDDCSPACGNGFVDAGETCDGNCPTAGSCDDGNPGTADTLTGSANTCNAACRNTAIVACVGNDGFCPSGCTSANDSDCSASCGNDLIESGETCDGDCPSLLDCSDGDACTADSVAGSANSCTAMCVSTSITACIDGDGCCAAGCSYTNDDDCPTPTQAALDCTDDSTWPADWKALEVEILAETNRRRTAAGGQTCGSTHYPAAGTLTFDPRLREAARCHALDMITNNFFSHSGSDGSRVGARVDRTSYYWQYVGENLAAGNETAVKIVDQWMGSETHCKNVMKPVYEELGVGYAYGANTTYKEYSAQAFGTEF